MDCCYENRERQEKEKTFSENWWKGRLFQSLLHFADIKIIINFLKYFVLPVELTEDCKRFGKERWTTECFEKGFGRARRWTFSKSSFITAPLAFACGDAFGFKMFSAQMTYWSCIWIALDPSNFRKKSIALLIIVLGTPIGGASYIRRRRMWRVLDKTT